jgi:ferritin
MLSTKMQDALNQQVNAEMYSAYLYLAMSVHFDAQSLKGAAHWMRTQYDEEMIHAFKLLEYVQGRGGQMKLAAIGEPEPRLESPLGVFTEALEHERKVTAMFNNLMGLATDERDFASASFLQWFIDEQVEEEASVDEIVQQLTLVGESKNGLFMVDRNLAERAAPVAAQPAE